MSSAHASQQSAGYFIIAGPQCAGKTTAKKYLYARYMVVGRSSRNDLQEQRNLTLLPEMRQVVMHERGIHSAIFIDVETELEIIQRDLDRMDAFMFQPMRHLTDDDVDGFFHRGSVLICDRDRKWGRAVPEFVRSAGVHVVQTPVRAPNFNAQAERFVRSIKSECLNCLIPLGERHLRRAIAEYAEHYHRERNHQGLGNELIDGAAPSQTSGAVRREQRLGGILNYYRRAA